MKIIKIMAINIKTSDKEIIKNINRKKLIKKNKLSLLFKNIK